MSYGDYSDLTFNWALSDIILKHFEEDPLREHFYTLPMLIEFFDAQEGISISSAVLAKTLKQLGIKVFSMRRPYETKTTKGYWLNQKRN